jgi:hypothetical protein
LPDKCATIFDGTATDRSNLNVVEKWGRKEGVAQTLLAAFVSEHGGAYVDGLGGREAYLKLKEVFGGGDHWTAVRKLKIYMNTTLKEGDDVDKWLASMHSLRAEINSNLPPTPLSSLTCWYEYGSQQASQKKKMKVHIVGRENQGSIKEEGKHWPGKGRSCLQQTWAAGQAGSSKTFQDRDGVQSPGLQGEVEGGGSRGCKKVKQKTR